MKIFLFSGEPSGELYLNYLIEGFQNFASDIEYVAINKKVSTVGFYEGIKKSYLLFPYLKNIENEIKKNRPDIFIAIGFSNFNLFLIKRIKELKTQIVYFAPPQIWAWGKRRYKILKKYVNKVICLFPFEKEFYEKVGIKAVYLGNPLLEIVKIKAKKEIKKRYKIEDEKVLVLMPGSRNEEIKRNLLFFLKIYQKLNQVFFIKPFILGLKELNYKKFNFLNLPIIYDNHYELISVSDLVLTSFGTSTLETVILNKPFIAIYFPSILTYFIGKFLIKIKYFSLPNILLNEKIFPEFIRPKLDEVYQIAKLILEKRIDYQSYFEKIKKFLNDKKEIQKNIILHILAD